MSEIKAMLIGGPSHLPAAQRLQTLTTPVDTIKLQFGAGYEHYVHRGEHTTIDDVDVLIYRWTMRTAIAE